MCTEERVEHVENGMLRGEIQIMIRIRHLQCGIAGMFGDVPSVNMTLFE